MGGPDIPIPTRPAPDFGCCAWSTDPATGAVTLTCSHPPAKLERDQFGRPMLEAAAAPA